jgi:hypothetical protein
LFTISNTIFKNCQKVHKNYALKQIHIHFIHNLYICFLSTSIQNFTCLTPNLKLRNISTQLPSCFTLYKKSSYYELYIFHLLITMQNFRNILSSIIVFLQPHKFMYLCDYC